MNQLKINTIGIGIAFSPNLQANICESARLAVFFAARLILIHVGDSSDEKISKIERYLEPFRDQGVAYEVCFRNGDPVEVILEIAGQQDIDLLMLGALQREKMLQFYIGSIARKITRKARCAVLLHINPSVVRLPCRHIVVDGGGSEDAASTVLAAFYVASKLGTDLITVVEEIGQDEVSVTVEDDKSLRRSTIIREKLRIRERARIEKLLENIPGELKSGVVVKSQPIFGRRGYSIGHYAEVVRADLLVIRAPGKSTVLDRVFPHDIEYILKELPTDVLILP